MSDSGEYMSTASEDPRELLVSVQLYISAAMEITFRKVRPIHSEGIQLSDRAQPVVTHKKSDLKRDSTVEDNKFKGLLFLMTSQMNDRSNSKQRQSIRIGHRFRRG